MCGSDRQWQNVILRLPHCEKIFRKRNITFATVKGLRLSPENKRFSVDTVLCVHTLQHEIHNVTGIYFIKFI